MVKPELIVILAISRQRKQLEQPVDSAYQQKFAVRKFIEKKISAKSANSVLLRGIWD